MKLKLELEVAVAVAVEAGVDQPAASPPFTHLWQISKPDPMPKSPKGLVISVEG